MRIWIGPAGETVDVEYLSHSLFVAQNTAMFGLDAEIIGRHMAAVNDPDGDVDFDYDTLIVLAEMNGWVRISRDCLHGGIAVSASDKPGARTAIRTLLQKGPVDAGVDLELERVVGHVIERWYCALDSCEVDQFVERGRLPSRSMAHIVGVSDICLLDALEHTEILPRVAIAT